MPQIQISAAQRRELRSQAHHLEPVVMVGSDGWSPAICKEAEHALSAHGLIKIRVFLDDRGAREALLARLADELSAAPVQHIGKLLVLWRPAEPEQRSADPERKPAPREVKVLKYSSRGGQRPEVKTLRVLGNQRLTSGGKVKRAKPRKISIKKSSKT